MSDPAIHWKASLADWALPQELLDAAPESPWGHDPRQFADRANRAAGRDLPPDRTAAAALPRLGTVLDVGCGGGAAVVALGVRGRRVIGVDASDAMLAVFRVATDRWWRRIDTIQGRWPDVEAPAADVVLCHDVVYDVPELSRFVSALTAHARRRVVLVLPEIHPMSWLSPYFEALHGLARPTEPTVDDALAVVRATGVSPQVDHYRDATRWGHTGSSGDDVVAAVRRRLCVGPERDDDLRRAIRRTPPPTDRAVVAMWWETGA